MAGIGISGLVGKTLQMSDYIPTMFINQAYTILGITWTIVIIVGILFFLKLRQELRNTNIKLEQVEKSQNLMVLRIDDKGNIIYANQYMRERLGYKKEEIKTKVIFDILLVNDHSKLQRMLESKEARLRKNSIDLNFITNKYKKIYAICTIKWDIKEKTKELEKTEIEISAIDIEQYYLSEKNSSEINSLYEEIASSEEEIQRRFEELCEKQEALQRSEERYSLVVETASMGIWDYDINKNKAFLSQKLREIIGIDEEIIYDKEYIKALMHPTDFKLLEKENKLCSEGEKDSFEIECRIKHKERGYTWIYLISKWLRDEKGELIRVAGSITDIHQKKIHEEKIKYIAYYDDLTGMTNKNYLKNTFEAYAKKVCVLVHLDIDNFKFINDSFGHEYGDLTLIEIGNRLKSISNKKVKISRMGADEFAILLLDIKNREEVKTFMNSIANTFNEPFDIKDIKFGLSYSAGIAMYPEDGSNFDEIMTSADTAMHKAKEEGKRKYIFFDNQFKKVFLEKIHMENDLRKAIKNDEFVLYYQPQVSIIEGKIKGFEALIRWIKPDGTMIPPFKFITTAEETGLMIPIGEWVIKEACTFINRLKDQGYGNLYVAVNISVVQLTQDDFVETVEKILEETQVDATKLHIEITETMLMECIDVNIEKINRIKKKGVIISLDDFGKGYSSLTYLKKLPINVLKIEKAFIDDIIANNNKNITGAIINLGHELALEVVAEGVEEKSQLDYLEQYKCDVIQGYFISKPIPENQVFNFLKER